MRVVSAEGNEGRGEGRIPWRVRPSGRLVGKRVLGLFGPAEKAPPAAPDPTATTTMRPLDDYLDATLSLEPRPSLADDRHPDRASLESHLARRRYGRFTLTEAIRPGWHLDIVPRAGYRLDTYVDPAAGSRLPAVIAAASSEDLFEIFVSLLAPLGDTVDVVLEGNHADAAHPEELTREGIERTVLESLLWDYEDLLLDDGCTGIAVLHPERPMEVQFDAHKLLVVYAHGRTPFERILRDAGLERDDRLRFISQGEHLHASHERFAGRFSDFAGRLGAE